MTAEFPISPAAIILLVVGLYLLVRVFLLSRPMHERTLTEIFEDMLMELIGAAVVVIAVLIGLLFF
tara:strand:- start:49 stop:246 length:198 start_codon:yes stop_codon:yes gene_type:complete